MRGWVGAKPDVLYPLEFLQKFSVLIAKGNQVIAGRSIFCFDLQLLEVIESLMLLLSKYVL